jgi:hypothetical protein
MSPDRIEVLSRSLADATSRRSLLKLLGVGAAGTAVTAIGPNTVGRRNEALAAEIENQLTNLRVSARKGNARFNGKFDVTSFRAAEQGELGNIVAIGNVTGKLRKNGKSKSVSQDNVIVPVTVQSSEVQTLAICQVLRLVLGPIHLNLLGLILDTNRIVITLRADSEGGLLGSLLCGLAGGVDDLGLQTVIDLLNDILDALTGAVSG